MWVPAALRHATNLRELDLSACPFTLSAGDVKGTLSRLRMLRLLCLSSTRRPTEAAHQELRQALPALRLA